MTIISICFGVLILLVVLGHKQGVPVFLYHEIGENYGTRISALEEHFKYIKSKKMKTFTADEVEKILSKGEKLPKNSILFTFDDGYYDNYTNLFPLLKKYNIKATIFLNTAYVKEKHNNKEMLTDITENAIKDYLEDGRGSNGYLSWDSMREMEKSGLVDIQLHTHSHSLIFSDNKLIGFVKSKAEKGRHFSNLYNYNGKLEVGYPIFKQRGETSAKKIIIIEEYLEKIRLYYETHLINYPKRKQVQEGQKYINKLSQKFAMLESDIEYEKRITKEIELNKELIEEKLNKKAYGYAWPWGDYGKKSTEIIKKLGIRLFFTCIRGTNNRKMKLDFIKRNGLKNNNIFNFKVRVFITGNLFLGMIFEFISTINYEWKSRNNE